MGGMEIIGKRLAEKRMKDTTDLRKDIRFISDGIYAISSEGKHNNSNNLYPLYIAGVHSISHSRSKTHRVMRFLEPQMPSPGSLYTPSYTVLTNADTATHARAETLRSSVVHRIRPSMVHNLLVGPCMRRVMVRG